MLVTLRAPAKTASGKQGTDVVYTLWRGAQVLRDYVVPTNPQSADQQAIRAFVSTLTKAWDTLSGSNRASWDTYAQANPVQNRMGEPVVIPALSAFVQLNTIHLTRGGSRVDTAPTSTAPSSPTGLTLALVQAGGTQLEFTVDHGYTTLTNLWLLTRTVKLATIAVTPKPSKMVLIEGVVSTSFKALAPTGSSYHYTATRTTWAAPDIVGVSVQIVNQYGQTSAPYTTSGEYTT